MGRSGLTVLVHRDGALESRQYRIPRWALRAAAGAGGLVTVGILAALVHYGPILVAAARAPLLEREVARLRGENRRVAELARALDEAEGRYAHLRGMLGADAAPRSDQNGRPARGPSEVRLYVAPPLLARGPDAGTVAPLDGPSVPRRWPLSVGAFRTRGLAAGGSGEEGHPGVDLAVPVGSEVRASGGGVVRATGSDSAYGMFVLLQHPEDYETMYGHLSRVLVGPGEQVRAGQVIALSGNTGRSTAPHLHFEVRHSGRSVDPLSLVREGT